MRGSAKSKECKHGWIQGLKQQPQVLGTYLSALICYAWLYFLTASHMRQQDNHWKLYQLQEKGFFLFTYKFCRKVLGKAIFGLDQITPTREKAEKSAKSGVKGTPKEE